MQEAVRNCAVHLEANYVGRVRLHQKAENPFKKGCDPELDTSPKLDSNASSFYLTYFGIPRWMIELGRIDIITKMSLLSTHVTFPRDRH